MAATYAAGSTGKLDSFHAVEGRVGSGKTDSSGAPCQPKKILRQICPLYFVTLPPIFYVNPDSIP
jgi:hypothetical protein